MDFDNGIMMENFLLTFSTTHNNVNINNNFNTISRRSPYIKQTGRSNGHDTSPRMLQNFVGMSTHFRHSFTQQRNLPYMKRKANELNFFFIRKC